MALSFPEAADTPAKKVALSFPEAADTPAKKVAFLLRLKARLIAAQNAMIEATETGQEDRAGFRRRWELRRFWPLHNRIMRALGAFYDAAPALRLVDKATAYADSRWDAGVDLDAEQDAAVAEDGEAAG